MVITMSWIRNQIQLRLPWVFNRLRVMLYAFRIVFYPSSILHTTGYWRCLAKGSICDANDKPLPYLNYAVIHFLQLRLRPEMTVFEYGAGFSTLFFAARCSHVTSVEHDAGWVKQLIANLPENTSLSHVPLVDGTSEYENAIAIIGGSFDLILVDGRRRVACVTSAVRHVSPTGAIILDNSERPRYADAHTFMASNGYKSLHFVGLAPWGIVEEQSTLFYRPDNVFGI